MAIKYKRILLKLSGEALMGDRNFGIDPTVVQTIAEEISDIPALLLLPDLFFQERIIRHRMQLNLLMHFQE